MNYVFQFGAVWKDADLLLLGAWLTVKLSFLTLAIGLVVGTGLLVNRTLNRNDPGKNYEVKIVLRPLHFGIGIRRGQTELLQWLNTFIYTIKNNGELDAVSRKWRQLPLEQLPVF